MLDPQVNSTVRIPSVNFFIKNQQPSTYKLAALAAQPMASSKDTPWAPSSWRTLPASQQPKYPDQGALNSALSKIARLPPIVAVAEIDQLRSALAECAEDRKQDQDFVTNELRRDVRCDNPNCANRKLCDDKVIEDELVGLSACVRMQSSQCSNIYVIKHKPPARITFRNVHGSNRARFKGVLVAPRLAGQFAKPRSKDVEEIDGKEVEVFRGENVNSFEADARSPDPDRLVQGYFHSSTTMNCARVVIAEGLADLRRASAWDMDFVKNKVRRKENEEMAAKILSALNFMETVGVEIDPILRSVDFFISHEGLHLPYEEAMTRQHSNGKYYNVGAHFLWIGDRTRQLDHAHVEYFRGIANPIGLKVGPTMESDRLVELIKVLWPDPEATPGKMTLITRFGHDLIGTKLPPLIKAVQESKLKVVWTCDPMHGNTSASVVGEQKFKTRSFEHILSEIEQCISIHKGCGSFLAGVHLELTGENVTECTGGPEQLTDQDLPLQYNTYCDPRLNYAQSIEVAFRFSEYHSRSNGSNDASKNHKQTQKRQRTE